MSASANRAIWTIVETLAIGGKERARGMKCLEPLMRDGFYGAAIGYCPNFSTKVVI
jgi:hypothetical protein